MGSWILSLNQTVRRRGLWCEGGEVSQGSLTVPPSRPDTLSTLTRLPSLPATTGRLRLHQVRPSTVRTNIVIINQPASSLKFHDIRAKLGGGCRQPPRKSTWKLQCKYINKYIFDYEDQRHWVAELLPVPKIESMFPTNDAHSTLKNSLKLKWRELKNNFEQYW